MDVYQTVAPKTISQPEIDSLMLIYQPIIGSLAVQLYVLLAAQSRHQPQMSTFNHLATLTNATISEVNKAKEKCESVFLITSYQKITDQQTITLFELQPVLDIQQAIAHQVLGRLLVKIYSPMVIEQIKQQFTSLKIDTTGFEVVKPVAIEGLLNWEAPQEQAYQQNRIVTKTIQTNQVNVFNSTLFNQTCSELLFPIKARTKENLELIVAFGNTYGIDEATMERLVGNSIRFKDKTLDVNKLQRLCESTKSVVNELPEDKYLANSLDFLASKQGGKAVGASDKKVLAFLSEYGFDQAVQNILIEYVIEHYGGTFLKNNVEFIADSWLRAKVTDRKAALKQVGKGYSKKTNQSLPTHMETPPETVVLTAQKRAELIAQLKGGKAHEKD